ncbi:aminotransferase class III-fold pyridoxal phosphate-dependent enzyme [Halonatronum saccharophilum]|uniref:aminotransferase class III-fold pyridoxal phosphate-dependent enzyme n=1 Tax=Halonatronum saccharophilum TaxID=150060 RepID=UPI000485DCE3|nr:aminotransferase class III-fold pyridoxal phosphate-dependent enzyme [Halonatronum saccharophilum]
MGRVIEETISNYENHLNSGMAKLFKFMGLDTLEWKGEGVYVQDIEGKNYIDCLGGYGTFSLGHRPKEVVEAVKEQLDLMPLSSKILFNQALGGLAKRLAQISPGDLKYSFICNSGTEAVEGAIKLARMWKGRSHIISTVNSFHGKSLGALSVTGRDPFRKPFKPLLPDVEHVPFGDVAALLSTINHNTAAVILEPIQGEGGINLPPKDYLRSVREACDIYGVALILDEVQTGLGRTGKMFACEHYGISPDILVTAKALGGGVMPIGAFTATEELWEVFNENPFIHTSTFGGNPLACRAALATIKKIEDDNLIDRAKEMGNYLLEGLTGLAYKYPDIIEDVRGKGLMIGVEFIHESYGGALISYLVEEGILAAYTLNKQKVIRLEPPLIIRKEEIDKILESFDRSLDKVIELAS